MVPMAELRILIDGYVRMVK